MQTSMVSIAAELEISYSTGLISDSEELLVMPAKEIHPKNEDIKVVCNCGNTFNVKSTLCRELHLEICSKCHPFYTGQQKMVDTAGMVQKFRDKYAKRGKKKAS